jgi:hypothetical protein
MIQLTCDECRLVWEEARGRADSPAHPLAFLCPRCGTVAELPPLTFGEEEPVVEGHAD